MRYALLLLLLIVAALGSDLGPSEREPVQVTELQPVIFAAAFGSN